MIYSISLRKVQLHHTANKGQRWLGVSWGLLLPTREDSELSLPWESCIYLGAGSESSCCPLQHRKGHGCHNLQPYLEN